MEGCSDTLRCVRRSFLRLCFLIAFHCAKRSLPDKPLNAHLEVAADTAEGIGLPPAWMAQE